MKLIDPATLLILFTLVLAALVLRTPLGKGRRGEKRVIEQISRGLPRSEYHQFHDVTLDVVDGTTQIDHIVISRYGVFVVETKNYKGWIFGDARSKKWTQSIFGKKYYFQNPLHQNYKHVKAVQALAGLTDEFVHSVVVFVGDSEFKTSLPANVTDLKGFVPFVRSKTDIMLSESHVETLRQLFDRHKTA